MRKAYSEANPASTAWSTEQSHTPASAFGGCGGLFTLRESRRGDDELRTSVYPSNFAPIAAKLRQRAFQTICKFRCFDAENFFFGGIKRSKFANRLKCALPKFRSDRSEVRRVNGRFRNLDPVLGALLNLSTDTK